MACETIGYADGNIPPICMHLFLKNIFQMEKIMGVGAALALKNEDGFKPEGVMAQKQARENKWARHRVEIKSACSAVTDEEIGLYECVALASWESR